jgi:peptidoglycan/xylan/chitin deacetylase (PgdA/CDA1 family)
MTRIILPFLLSLFAGALALTSPESVEETTPTKRIALTFDDVPRGKGGFFTSDERTRLLIDALRKAEAPQAVFFVNPGRIAKRPGAEDRITAYIAAGHVIANHTSTHPRLSQTETRDYIADIELAADWLEGREGTRPWFRYPFLDEGRSDKIKRDAVRETLLTRGLLNASPTVDASDWWLEAALGRAEREGRAYSLDAARALFVDTHVEAAEFYHTLALETFEQPIAHNMLLHETDLSALFIGDLISALRAKGWTLISADEAFADPAYLSAPDVPSAQGTLVELAAWYEGIGSQRWYPGNDTHALEQRFRREVLGEEMEPQAK